MQEFGGVRLLISDARVALLLVDEARCRTLERLFGVSRQQANLATLVAIGVIADATHETVRNLITGPGGPRRTDAWIGAGVFEEAFRGVAGPGSRDTSWLGPLVATALIGAWARPAVRGSLRGVRGFAHQSRASFNRRYGYPIVARRSGSHSA
jgi:hypothetical protein